MVECKTCGGEQLKPLYSCAVHGVTLKDQTARHPKPPFDPYQTCLLCLDYARPVESPAKLEASIRSMTPPHREAGWVDLPEVQEMHRRLLQEQIANPPAYPGGFEGDGVVIPGGGAYWPSAYIAVRALRHFGCTLPIEVWHRGGAEPVEPNLLAEWGAESVDSSAVMPQGRIVCGWESKLFAAERCRFRRVLVIDADVTAFSNADDWFRLLETRPFAVTPDHSTQKRKVHFERHGVPPDGGQPVNSGVQLIDKAAAWPFLALARWLNDHSDYYYQQLANRENVLGYGDQDCTRLALAATKTPFHFFGPAPPLDGIGVVQRDWTGKPLAGHRFHGKLYDSRWGKPANSNQLSPYKQSWPHEDLVHGYLREFRALTRGPHAIPAVPRDDRPIVHLCWPVGPALSLLEWLNLHLWLKRGFIPHLWSYDHQWTASAPVGVVRRDAGEILPASSMFRFAKPVHGLPSAKGSLAQWSDVFELTLLHRLGGWYAQLDVSCLIRPDPEPASYWPPTKAADVPFQTCVVKQPAGAAWLLKAASRIPREFQPAAAGWFDALAVVSQEAAKAGLTPGGEGIRLEDEGGNRYLLEHHQPPAGTHFLHWANVTCEPGRKDSPLPGTYFHRLVQEEGVR